jgi:hypothetical protein
MLFIVDGDIALSPRPTALVRSTLSRSVRTLSHRNARGTCSCRYTRGMSIDLAIQLFRRCALGGQPPQEASQVRDHVLQRRATDSGGDLLNECLELAGCELLQAYGCRLSAMNCRNSETVAR